jgi:hypothetical protein
MGMSFETFSDDYGMPVPECYAKITLNQFILEEACVDIIIEEFYSKEARDTEGTKPILTDLARIHFSKFENPVPLTDINALKQEIYKVLSTDHPRYKGSKFL